MPPPKGTSGKQSYLTAVTEIDKELVEILDVEKYWKKFRRRQRLSAQILILTVSVKI